jgi:hypothetical protein
LAERDCLAVKGAGWQAGSILGPKPFHTGKPGYPELADTTDDIELVQEKPGD